VPYQLKKTETQYGWGRPLNYKFLESDADFYDFMDVPHCPQI